MPSIDYLNLYRLSLISSIDSVIMHSGDYELKIGLRTLKVFLLLRKPELKVELMNQKLYSLSTKWDGYGECPKPSSLLSLFLKILGLILDKEIGSEMLSEVHSLGKEVDSAFLNRMSQSSLLTVDEILWISDAIVDSAVDSLDLVLQQRAGVPNYSLQVIDAGVLQVIDSFRVHMVIMRNFLHFTKQTAIELENVLFHIKPIVINAARVFIRDESDDASNWFRDVESYCLAVNRMASDPQVYQAYSQALAAASTVLLVAPSHVDHGVLMNFLDSLISILWDVLGLQSDSDSRTKHQFKVL